MLFAGSEPIGSQMYRCEKQQAVEPCFNKKSLLSQLDVDFPCSLSLPSLQCAALDHNTH